MAYQQFIYLFISKVVLIISATDLLSCAYALEFSQVVAPTLPSSAQPSPVPSKPTPPSEPGAIPERITVTEFELVGNTVFSDEALKNLQIPSTDKLLGSVTQAQPLALSFEQLLQIASAVADYYAQRGYRTSGAVIFIPEQTRANEAGKVQIRVIEGKLEQINVSGGRLNNYVRSRLRVNLEQPLNVVRLLESLQLLQLDPLIETISATLSVGGEPGETILDVSYRPADSFSLPITLDNARSPSVGSFERGVAIEQGNLLGLGDSIKLGYVNTDGSDRLDFSYQIPVNPNNGTIGFEYTYSDNEVIEPPFDDINEDGESPDITSDYESYDLTLRQPIIRSIDNQTYTEFAIGLTASWRRTQSFLFGQPFPLALSADVAGNTRIFALRFSQEFTRQTPTDIFALRSQFSFGLDAFESTVVEEIPGVEVIPDSRFFAWRGQIQYVRVLQPDILLLVQSNLQLADPLVPIEQFSLGGLGSVLGYRQDLLLTDNGFFASTEIRFPLLRVFRGEGVLQIIPFIDYGIGWNSSRASPDPNSLASVGVGLLYRQGNLSARFDWGIPLVNVEGRDRTWQENGLYFTIQYSPF